MFVPQSIPDVVLIRPKRFGDARGYVSEVHRKDWSGELGADVQFVQENESLSLHSGTVRGLHFQTPPYVQAKLVRCVRGSIFDVAVDIRRRSASFGRHVSRRLTASDGEQLFVPEGFAHGFCTLEPDTLVLYKLSAPYRPAAEAGIFWNDAELGIEWPVDADRAILSERDMALPRLQDLMDGSLD
jgi:dTDP-4-dehydrorhamnose 3,5-epimerase